MIRTSIQTALLVGAALAPLAAASAQQAAPGAPAPAASGEGVGEIIVTAQRRSENVMKVPLSVSVVSADTLVKRGVNDLSGVTKLAPSLQVAQDNTYSIRGVGTATFATTVESSVSQMVDDVVLGNGEFAANAFYDLERVEVLNGPQGLLFGKNASAGLINITTAKPKIGKLEGNADVELVTRDRPIKKGQGIQARATLNLPVSETSALRLNAIYSGQDAVTYPMVNANVRNDMGIRNLGLRAKYLWQPDSALSVYILGDYNRQRGVSGRYDITYRQFGAGSAYTGLGLPSGINNQIFQADAPNFRDSETGGAQANISYTFDNGVQLINIAAWKHMTTAFTFDSDETQFNFFNTNSAHQNYNQFSEELRLALPSGNRITGQAGLYYYHSQLNQQSLLGGNNGFPAFLLPTFPFCVGATQLGAPPAACPVSNTTFLGQDSRFNLKQNSFAGFGQLSYGLTDTLKATAGGRVTYDKANIDLLENTGHYFVTLGIPNNRSIQQTDATNFSYKIGLDWQVTPATLIYGFYGRGYKGPGFSNTAPAPGANLAVRPEISKGGEIGIKTRLFDNHLTLSLSGFYTRYTDLQVQSWITALRTFVLANAATATTKGVDASFSARVAKGLTLSGAATYADAKYNDFPGAQCYPTQTTGGCSATQSSFNAGGYQIPLSARFSTTLGADYQHALNDRLDGLISLSYYHRSSLSAGFGPAFQIPSWDTLDATIGIKTAAFNVALFCKNCTNAIRPISIGSDGGDASLNPAVLTLNQRFGYNSVRTIGVRAGINF
ncbi:TonB-dependent receptor [Novosphingobium humi]|uniref:TonB-dependent receptor n=1 Tax=Novosphingobium humi TaxID=2282397 RepID=A0ABY7TYE2_9SPHN|nr:TonB-dependent receptor [Novosphingobium humi]WCT78292.1 TonB-dependent receptor [Novosphingobium humi]